MTIPRNQGTLVLGVYVLLAVACAERETSNDDTDASGPSDCTESIDFQGESIDGTQFTQLCGLEPPAAGMLSLFINPLEVDGDGNCPDWCTDGEVHQRYVDAVTQIAEDCSGTVGEIDLNCGLRWLDDDGVPQTCWYMAYVETPC